MKYILIIAYLLLSGCIHAYPGKCLDKSVAYARDLQKAGYKPTVVYGTYRGCPHAWIEMSGRIYDQTQSDTTPEYYKSKGIIILRKK